MPSLTDVYNSLKIDQSQKETFLVDLDKLVQKGGGDKHEKALLYLSELRARFKQEEDSKETSRQNLLEDILDSFESKLEERAMFGLAILVGIHFDYKYLNRQKWYDRKLIGCKDLPFEELTYLCAAASLLDIQDIFDAGYWEGDFISAFLKG